LIKITNYAKGVIQQTGRHIEKASWLKSRDNFNLKSTFFNILFHRKVVTCRMNPNYLHNLQVNEMKQCKDIVNLLRKALDKNQYGDI